MTGTSNTHGKLLPRNEQAPGTERDERPTGTPLKHRLLVAAVWAGAALCLAFLAVPQEAALRSGGGANAVIGLLLLLLLMFFLFYRDIKRYRPALIDDVRRMVLLAVLLVTTVGMAVGSEAILTELQDRLLTDDTSLLFALPVAAGAMLVSMLLDFHLTLGFSFLVSLLLGIRHAGEPFLPFYYFIGSIVAGLLVVRCKKRTTIIRAGAVTAAVNAAAVLCIGLYHGDVLEQGMFDAAAAAAGAVASTMVVSVLLPFLEAVFDIATDIKLLELLDPHQPLLKKLVYTTPGTYHHSILIGNLAEAAAEAIGENPLLARVGAYYHDVGKMRKPEYFIENQRPQENKHDKLAPSMSSLIIAAHVKDGVELAREHRLPATVIDIIQQHHGTALISYFFRKARDQQPSATIAEEDYRYPGPRPRTKVAAIVMLADAVEAASRTLEDPTPQNIHALTTSVISRIFLDDQLIRCDLTLKDLRVIARNFDNVLAGVYHQRIDYPGSEFSRERKRGDHPDRKQTDEETGGNGGGEGASPEGAFGPRTA